VRAAEIRWTSATTARAWTCTPPEGATAADADRIENSADDVN
jgi:hypothetical protein